MSWSAAIARIVVATFVVAGCAPSGDSTPPLAAAVPRAAAVAAATPGLLYLRSDSVAYAADAAPAGIAGASLVLATSSATTDSSGQFVIQGPAQAGAAPVALRAYADGFVPMRYPWMASEAGSTARLGTYAQTESHPRPGFLAGIIPHDMGGWLQPTYEAGMFPSTYDRIRDVAGGNTVVFVDPAWLTAYNAAAATVTIGTGPATGGFGMAPRAMYEDMVAMAHSRGLQFMMMLGIEPDASVGSAGMSVSTSNTAYWNAFFDAWAVHLAERAAIARDLGIEHIALGYGLGSLWQLGPTQWQKAINAVRGTGYTGKISNFISASGYYQSNPYAPTTFADGTHDRAAFMGLFDAIGINFYDVVWRDSFQEEPSRAQTRAKMRAGIKTVLDDLQVSPVPVMVMVGTPSVHGGASYPEYIEPCLLCNSLAPSRTRDYLQQADVYQAVAEVIDAQPTGNGHVMGLLSWGYQYRDDFSWGLNPGDSAYDKSGSIRGKPAEAVVHWWFRNWTRSDRDRVFDWAESVYPQFFPAPSAAGNYFQYSFRYYPLTGNYLAEGDGQVIIHNGVTWNFLNVGPLSNFTGPAKTAGF